MSVVIKIYKTTDCKRSIGEKEWKSNSVYTENIVRWVNKHHPGCYWKLVSGCVSHHREEGVLDNNTKRNIRLTKYAKSPIPINSRINAVRF